jgi:hypothetical protein
LFEKKFFFSQNESRFVGLINLNPFIMKNKSLTAIALLALFTVTIAASAATQFAPDKKADKNEKSIDKRKIKVPTWG